MSDDIQEIPSATPDFQTELARQLQELVPEAIADGKVDIVKLKELLDEDVADESERFGLFWPGKKRALHAAQEPTTATLRPDKDNSKDWDTTKNVFIEGDNLEVLKILQKHYHGKIKMIYIDPPYNTGKDFIYPDNYKEGLDTYLEWTKQVNAEGKTVSTNSETEGRYHSNWLNMMYPRLKLSRNLLSPDGLIFVSIDDNEFNNLKRILDEIYGESNFVATLAVELSKTQGMKVAAAQNGQIVKNHEYILVYARNAHEAQASRRPLYDSSELYDSHYDIVWSPGGQISSLTEMLNADKLSVETFQRYGLRIGKAELKTVLSIDEPYYEYFLDNLAPNLYRESPIALDSIQQLDVPSGLVINHSKYLLRRNSKGKTVQLQPFLDGVRTTDDYSPRRVRATIRGALWKGFHSDMMNVGREGGVEFKNGKKPLRLIKQLIKWANRPNGIVLDFFAGSGTTAEAVVAMNAEDGGHREFILVQLPEPIGSRDTVSDITRSRLMKLAYNQSEDHSGPIDQGFRSYTLQDTNFKKWRAESDSDLSKLEKHLFELRDSADDGASPEGLLSELLLKQGYSLSEGVSRVQVSGLELHSVGDGLLLAYLDEHIKPTIEQLREAIDLDPARFVILEDAFQGDDELKTNLAQLSKSKGVELWTA